MKTKLLLLSLLPMAGVFTNASAWTTTITTGEEFQTAWSALSGAGGADTILCSSPVGTPITVSRITAPTGGMINIVGVGDVKPRLSIATIKGAATPENSDLGFKFENLELECTDSYLLDYSNMYNSMDSLIFRNCDIIRSGNKDFYYSTTVKQKIDGVTFRDPKPLNYLEMSNCVMNSTGSNPIFYFGQNPLEIQMYNNTFYGVCYKGIFNMYSQTQSNSDDSQISFYNNTVAMLFPNGATLFSFQQEGYQQFSYLGYLSNFDFHNNMFLTPTWQINGIDPDYSKKVSILKTAYGMASFMNNLVDTVTNTFFTKHTWDADGETMGEPISLDTISNYRPEEIGWSWDDMPFAQENAFWIEASHRLATAGVDNSPMGDPRWYTDNMPVKAAVNITIEGSKSATVIIDPETKHFVGDEITLKVDTKGNLNKFLGWSDGSNEEIRNIKLEGDLNLTASFEEVPYIAVWSLDNLTKNNTTLTCPLAPNYANTEEECLLGVRSYRGDYFKDAANQDSTVVALNDYVDSLYVQTRNNKFFGDIRNCIVLRSTVSALNDLKKPDYAYITVPTKGFTGTEFSCAIGTDSYSCKSVKVEYSLDGKTWVGLTSVEICELAVWADVKVSLPEACNNQDKVYIRVIGDADNAARIMNEFFESGEMEPTYELLFVSNMMVGADATTAIETITTDSSRNGIVYDILGRRVWNKVAGQMYIENGKKIISK